ncbi:MAG: OmpA family protein [Alphaproteobacteria bacterium]
MNFRFSIQLVIVAGLTLGSHQALAQQPAMMDFNDPNVTVDMSVLNDNGVGVGPSGPMLSSPSGRRLLIPGDAMPQSRLYLKPPSGKKLPAAKPIRIAKPKPTPKPAPKAIAKAITKAITKAPAPVKAPTKPKIAKVATPKPAAKKPTKLTAPKKPVDLAKKSPPPMPPKQPSAPAKAEPPKVSIPIPQAKANGGKPVEKAAIPVAGQALKVGRVLRVAFAGQGTKLPATAKPDLANLAKQLKGSGTLRLQLLAYAGGDNLSSSLARRLSLSRALAVRSYLIERGVRSTRIDVRALGNKSTEQPLNRVDLNIAER